MDRWERQVSRDQEDSQASQALPEPLEREASPGILVTPDVMEREEPMEKRVSAGVRVSLVPWD